MLMPFANKIEQTDCQRCGNCCIDGGPALHIADLPLLQSGALPLSNLITLRKGELAHNPLTVALLPTKVELVKLKGSGNSWKCCYFDQNKNVCTIYEHRPAACRVLKCWRPEELLRMIEKDTLSRFDILTEDDPFLPMVLEHERLCPCPDLQELATSSVDFSGSRKRELLQLVRDDLQFRNRVVREFSMKVSEELLYFGRPIFQLLQALGVKITESPFGIELHWPK